MQLDANRPKLSYLKIGDLQLAQRKKASSNSIESSNTNNMTSTTTAAKKNSDPTYQQQQQQHQHQHQQSISSSNRVLLNDSNMNQSFFSTATIANTEYGFSIHSVAAQNNSLMNRSNNALQTPTNMSENGAIISKSNVEVNTIDEDVRIANKSKHQLSNNLEMMPSSPVNMMITNNSNMSSQLRENNKFNGATHLNSLRLPHVNSIESK